MSGRFSRSKGLRGERTVVHTLMECGVTANRVPLSGAAKDYPGDVETFLFGDDRVLEVKTRAKGFDRIYGWLGSNDGLVIRQDRCEPLLVIRLKDAARWTVEEVKRRAQT